ncbi:MAG: CsgG/HfaB family protein [Candidatus Bruticola sp.]
MNFRCKLFLSFIVLALGCFWLPLMVEADEMANQSGPFSVAVLDFDNSGSNYGRGSSDSPGTAIPAILTTELANSDRFTVVEREQLKAVLNEQKLGASGAVTAETAARIGQVLGVEYLIVGKVTQFNVERGKSKSFSMFGIGSSSKSPDIARVSIELKVLDSESARIVATASCRRDIEVGKGSSSTRVLGINSRSDNSGASDSAMADVYYAIAKDLADQLNTVRFKSLPAKVKYTGFVAHVEGDTVYINLGSKHGITQKMVFLVRREEQKGTIKFKKTVGEIQVINVDEGASECKVIKVESPNKVKNGDLIESKF